MNRRKGKRETGSNIPKCTGDPDRCRMCDLIGMIFEGFPTEENPGCEEGRPVETEEEAARHGFG